MSYLSPDLNPGINAIKSNQFDTPLAQSLVAFSEALVYTGKRFANREIPTSQYDLLSTRLIDAVEKAAKVTSPTSPVKYRRSTLF